MPDNYKDISPYHLIFTANLTSNEKTYQIEFVSEASEIVFQKKYELYVEDKFYIPKGLIDITPIASKAKNLETKSPYSEGLILEIANAFLASYKEDINRDIHKAYVGFNIIKLDSEQNIEKTIATGNWGCGAFGGNHILKFLQQWLAATLAGIQRLDYYTFGVKEMEAVNQNLEKMKKEFNEFKYYTNDIR